MNYGNKGRTCLEPIDTSSTRLIGRALGRQHLDHQSLTSILDTLFQECLNLIGRVPI
jgi:hypothetical protein